MFFLLMFVMLLILGFMATRLHMYHEAFNTRMIQRQNNYWLEGQCQQHEFYSNMKHHASLCDDIAKLHADAVWLHALRDVIDATSLCGSQSCEYCMKHVFTWFGTNGLHVMFSVSLVGVVLMAMTIPLYRRFTPNNYLVPYDMDKRYYDVNTKNIAF